MGDSSLATSSPTPQPSPGMADCGRLRLSGWAKTRPPAFCTLHNSAERAPVHCISDCASDIMNTKDTQPLLCRSMI